MQCPYCQKEIHINLMKSHLTTDIDYTWIVEYNNCPSCKKIIVFMNGLTYVGGQQKNEKTFMIYPKGPTRPKAAKEVPSVIANDFNEACLVFNDSLKASAALSRRCLQNVLRDIDGIKHGSLDSEIHQAIKILPHYLADAIDGIRNIGNFALHPMKSESSGEVVEVEPGEAEWQLEVLEQLFEHLYVQPKKLEERKNALNTKLEEMGKPPMKKKEI